MIIIEDTRQKIVTVITMATRMTETEDIILKKEMEVARIQEATDRPEHELPQEKEIITRAFVITIVRTPRGLIVRDQKNALTIAPTNALMIAPMIALTIVPMIAEKEESLQEIVTWFLTRNIWSQFHFHITTGLFLQDR